MLLVVSTNCRSCLVRRPPRLAHTVASRATFPPGTAARPWRCPPPPPKPPGPSTLVLWEGPAITSHASAAAPVPTASRRMTNGRTLGAQDELLTTSANNAQLTMPRRAARDELDRLAGAYRHADAVFWRPPYSALHEHGVPRLPGRKRRFRILKLAHLDFGICLGSITMLVYLVLLHVCTDSE